MKDRIWVHVRWMVQSDVRDFVPRRDGDEDLRGRARECYGQMNRTRNTVAMVAERGCEAVGFVCYRLRGVAVELVELAVRPDVRGHGVGRQLLEKVRSKVASARRLLLRADVPDDNLPAHLFLKACGLKARVLDGGTYRFTWRHQPVCDQDEMIELVEE